MTKEEILEKAIQKAIKNGWWAFDGRYPNEVLKVNSTATDVYLENERTVGHISVNDVIYDHDFAKALWGEQDVYTVGRGEPLGEGFHALLHPVIPRWQFHLREMVIAEDPLKYLGDKI